MGKEIHPTNPKVASMKSSRESHVLVVPGEPSCTRSRYEFSMSIIEWPDSGLDICGDPDDRPNNFHKTSYNLKQIF